MVEVFDEEMIPFAAAIRLLPGRPHISTGYRYALRGYHGIVLRTWLCGGRRFTSRVALREFIDAVTEASNSNTSNGDPIATRSNREADRCIEQTLDEEGI